MNEKINVVTKSVANMLNVGYDSDINLSLRLNNIPIEVKDRNKVETDQNYVQLIPYVILVDTYLTKMLLYKRKGTEERLTGQWSVGFGGHWLHKESLTQCMQREIREELDIPVNKKFTYFTHIFDTSNEVSSVHFGLVHLATMHMTMKEVSLLKPSNEIEWVGLLPLENEALTKYWNKLELWSRLTLEKLKEYKAWVEFAKKVS